MKCEYCGCDILNGSFCDAVCRQMQAELEEEEAKKFNCVQVEGGDNEKDHMD